MKVIFMGTSEFSVGTLEAIIAAGHEVVLAVSQPDKAAGRGKVLKPTPVKACALSHGIEVYQPVKVRDAECIRRLADCQPDIIIVVAFGQIITKEILELPRYGCVNVHASLLPKYRGAAPIQWAILNGDAKTGVTTMRMDEGIDTGDMILQREVRIAGDETVESLSQRLSQEGARLCVETMGAIGEGTAVYTPQENALATHTKKIRKEFGSIDWAKSAVSIERMTRGLAPWPGAYTRLGDHTFKIWRARVTSFGESGAPGSILMARQGRLLVQTGDGVLELLEVQLEGKKRMPTAAFLNGFAVKEGTVLRRG